MNYWQVTVHTVRYNAKCKGGKWTRPQSSLVVYTRESRQELGGGVSSRGGGLSSRGGGLSFKLEIIKSPSIR